MGSTEEQLVLAKQWANLTRADLARIDVRLDRMEERLRRVERRLDLVEV
jgi:hypothetical protein